MVAERLVVNSIVTGLELVCVNVQMVLKEVGLPSGPGPVDDAIVADLWRTTQQLTKRPLLPLEVGLALPFGTLGAVDYLASSAPSLGQALLEVQNAFPLIAPGVQMVFERLEKTVRLSLFNTPPFAGQAESDLFIIGVTVNRLSHFVKGPFTALQTELPVRRPAGLKKEHLPASLGVVSFRANVCSMTLSLGELERPMRLADRTLLGLMKRSLDLDTDNRDRLLASLHSVLLQRLPGVPALKETAAVLGMSARSLQRKLADSAMSYTQFVDGARRRVFEQLASQTTLSFDVISQRIGFQTQASLNKAVFRWTGKTPKAHRTSR